MRMPRLLPIIAVAISGVLAINFLGGARDLPGLLSGAQAFAEDSIAKASPKAKPSLKADPKAAEAKGAAPTQLAAASPLPPRVTPAQAAQAAAMAGACKPTDAAIGREAGLSPEQMRLLESLQTRRGQLDDRERSLEMQLSLLSAAEAKLDSRVATLNGLKAEIQALLGQAEAKQKAEADRMIGVYTTMAQSKPKEAAKQLTILDDSVRLPIAAGLSNRTLANILANMQPADAKKLNESLAHRFESQKVDATRAAAAAAAAVNPAPTPAAAKASATKAAAAKTPAPAAKPAVAKPADKAADKPGDAAKAAPAAADPTAAPVKPVAAKPRRPRPAAKKPEAADGAAPMKTDPAASPAADKPSAG